MKAWLARDISLLQSQIIGNTLPHALVLSGVQGSGKHELALWLTKSLLCQQTGDLNSDSSELYCGKCKSCLLLKAQTHPDHLFVELIKANIGVDQIRTVSRFFEKTSQLAQAQVVIIENADKMTESAANALLKTLEEPTQNSFIILLVEDAQRLLPTIISRSYLIHLRPPVGKKLLASLGEESNNPFVNLSHFPELTSPNIQEQFLLFYQAYMQFLLSPQYRMPLLKVLLSTEHSLRWLEKVTVDLLRNQYQWCDIDLFEGVNKTELMLFLRKSKLKFKSIYQLINTCSRQSVLLTQVNKEYCFEKLLVDISHLLTSDGD